jgi:hypothetical protein
MGTIYEVTKMWSRTASDASVSDKGQRFDISFREAYQITCTPDTEVLEIYQAPGLPAFNSLYPGTISVFLVNAVPQRVSPVLWIMDLSWAGEFGPDGPEDNPLNAPPVIEWTDQETDEPIDEDFDGNPIVTVNNEPIEGVTTKIADQVLNVQRNYADFSPYATAAYRRSVNSDTFQGYPAGTGKMIRFNAKKVYGEGQTYWNVSASIQFRLPYNTTAEKAWYSRVRHEGYYVKVGSIIRRALDNDINASAPGEPMVRPVLLKADGTIETNPANAVWLEFKRYGALPYNALGLL